MKRKWYLVDEDVQDILRRCDIQGNVVYLPEHMDSELYKRVNKVLEALGAKWDRKAGAHVAEYEIEKELREVIKTGHYYNWKKDTDFFETPECVNKFIDYFNPYSKDDAINILEPSAGKGNLLRYLRQRHPKAKLYAAEINPLHMKDLQELSDELYEGDFMEYEPGIQFDLVVMNPPFSQGIEHIMKAYSLLKSGGTLISCAEGGITYRQTGRYRKWNKFISDKYFELLKLPEKIFKESGTDFPVVLVGLTRFDTTNQQYQYCRGKTIAEDIIDVENVPDELYGITTMSVHVQAFLAGCRVFPCGSGNDYKLSEKMVNEIKTIIANERESILACA